MGSGCFPLKDDRLTKAANLVGQVIDDYWSDVYSGECGGMQFDNAASDGAALGALGIAKDLIERQNSGR
mgnify:CR=1 FL=1